MSQAFLQSAKSEGHIAGGVMADSEEAMKSMWFLREHISVALSKRGTL